MFHQFHKTASLTLYPQHPTFQSKTHAQIKGKTAGGVKLALLQGEN